MKIFIHENLQSGSHCVLLKINFNYVNLSTLVLNVF